MTIEYQDLESLLERIKLMPPEYRLRLMHGILQTLIPNRDRETVHTLQFGEYKDFEGPMSTFEDYTFAEWRPSEHELNGE